MIAENRAKVRKLLNILNPKVLGKDVSFETSKLGNKHTERLITKAIIPAGDQFPGQEMNFELWDVEVVGENSGKYVGKLSLTDLLDRKSYLAPLFAKYFGSYDEIEATRRAALTRYGIEYQGEDRYQLGLPMAVSIQNRERYTTLIIDWGREQFLAKQFQEWDELRSPNLNRGTEIYNQALDGFAKLLNPEVYMRGAKPTLSYEARYFMSLKKALRLFAQEPYSRFVVGGSTHNLVNIGGVQRRVEYTVNINFLKLPYHP